MDVEAIKKEEGIKGGIRWEDKYCKRKKRNERNEEKHKEKRMRIKE